MNDEIIPATICLNQELGELLLFSSKIATAIRMNSPYSSEYNKVVSGLKQFGFGVRADIDEKFNEHAYDVLNLSDSLQELAQLGKSIAANDSERIKRSCSVIISMYKEYEDKSGYGNRDDVSVKTMDTFQRWDSTSKYPLFSLQEGIDTLQKIIDKMTKHRAF